MRRNALLASSVLLALALAFAPGPGDCTAEYVAKFAGIRPKDGPAVQSTKTKLLRPVLGQDIRIPPTVTLTGYKEPTGGLAFSPNSRTLAIGIVAGVQLWDVGTNEERTVLKAPYDSWWRAIAFSPDGKLLAAGGESTGVQLWNVESKKHLAKLDIEYGGYNLGLAWDPNAKVLVAVGGTGGAGHLRCWDVEKRKLIVGHRPRGHWVHCAVFRPNGKDIVFGGSAGFGLIPNAASRPNKVDPDSRLGWKWSDSSVTALSSDGKKYASSDKMATLTLGAMDTGKEKRIMQAHDGMVWVLAFSPDGRMLASGGADKSVKLWDVTTGDLLVSLPGHIERIAGVAFSPDGKMLASGSSDRTVKLWDLTKLLKKMKRP
jgi:WD40 repeat protein